MWGVRLCLMGAAPKGDMNLGVAASSTARFNLSTQGRSWDEQPTNYPKKCLLERISLIWGVRMKWGWILSFLSSSPQKLSLLLHSTQLQSTASPSWLLFICRLFPVVLSGLVFFFRLFSCGKSVKQRCRNKKGKWMCVGFIELLSWDHKIPFKMMS